MWNIDNGHIMFDYKLLVPSPTTIKLRDSSNTRNSKTQKNTTRSAPFTECSILKKIAKSEEHKKLMSHHAIKFFIWMKWCLISKYVARDLRLTFLFLFCLSWYLLALNGVGVGNECTYDFLDICASRYGAPLNSCGGVRIFN